LGLVKAELDALVVAARREAATGVVSNDQPSSSP
jgi:hypothetical protein